jgi:hypothetical protein
MPPIVGIIVSPKGIGEVTLRNPGTDIEMASSFTGAEPVP